MQINVTSNNKTYFPLHVKGPIFCQIVSKCRVPRQIVRVPNIKFHENLSIGSHTDTCGWAYGWTTVIGTLQMHVKSRTLSLKLDVFFHGGLYFATKRLGNLGRFLELQGISGVSTWKIYLKQSGTEPICITVANQHSCICND
jgi:hypothetical protein